jgi:hypothetical protein
MLEDTVPRSKTRTSLSVAPLYGDEHVIKFIEACLHRHALGALAGLSCRCRPRAGHDIAPLTRLASSAVLRSRLADQNASWHQCIIGRQIFGILDET